MSFLSTPLTRTTACAVGFTSLALAASPLVGDSLTTRYSKERALEVSVTTETTNEVTNMEITIDGEPMDRGGRGGGGSTRTISYSYTDTLLEAKDGMPTKVQRSFDEFRGATESEGRDGPVEREAASSFEGITVVLTATDDDVDAEVTDGDAPDGDGRLTGHRLALPLDGLVPSDEIDAGDTWDVEGEALAIALGLGLERKLIDRPEREGGGEGRGGGGGRRGGMQRGGGGGGGLAALADGEWSITATYSGDTEEAGGVECAIIKYEIEVEGTIEQPQRGGRRDRAAGPSTTNVVPQETTYAGEFEGRLLWCIAEERPVQFTFEGSYQTEMETERETQRGVMQMSRSAETTVNLTVEIGVADAGNDD